MCYRNGVLPGPHLSLPLITQAVKHPFLKKVVNGDLSSIYGFNQLKELVPVPIFSKRVIGADNHRIHPTQKPVDLYKWLLSNYAEEGDKILDTHVGSGSSIIACIDMGFDYMGFEIDEDYYRAMQDRIYHFTRQETLW